MPARPERRAGQRDRPGSGFPPCPAPPTGDVGPAHRASRGAVGRGGVAVSDSHRPAPRRRPRVSEVGDVHRFAAARTERALTWIATCRRTLTEARRPAGGTAKSERAA